MFHGLSPSPLWGLESNAHTVGLKQRSCDFTWRPFGRQKFFKRVWIQKSMKFKRLIFKHHHSKKNFTMNKSLQEKTYEQIHDTYTIHILLFLESIFYLFCQWPMVLIILYVLKITYILFFTLHLGIHFHQLRTFHHLHFCILFYQQLNLYWSLAV